MQPVSAEAQSTLLAFKFLTASDPTLFARVSICLVLFNCLLA